MRLVRWLAGWRGGKGGGSQQVQEVGGHPVSALQEVLHMYLTLLLAPTASLLIR